MRTRSHSELRRRYDWVITNKDTPIGMTRVLTVRRNDEHDRIPYDDLYAIKNLALGEDVEAVEVYPAAVDLVDEINARHLWEWPRGAFPFNFNRRSFK